MLDSCRGPMYVAPSSAKSLKCVSRTTMQPKKVSQNQIYEHKYNHHTLTIISVHYAHAVFSNSVGYYVLYSRNDKITKTNNCCRSGQHRSLLS